MLSDPKALNAMDAKAARWEAAHFAKDRKVTQGDSQPLTGVFFATLGGGSLSGHSLRPLAFMLSDPKALNAMDAKAARWEAARIARGRKEGIFKHELTGIKGMGKTGNRGGCGIRNRLPFGGFYARQSG